MDLRQRKNHRLKDYDYGSNGYYYVTICTLNRENLLCNIVRRDTPGYLGKQLTSPATSLVAPSDIGTKVVECWNNIALLNENVEIDKFVLMPNHIHGIIIIKNTDALESEKKKYSFDIPERQGRRSLQGLIKDFKSVTTRHYKKLYSTDLSLWQESFYDEVINDQEHYNNVWQYIDLNPIKWEEDCYYTKLDL